MKSLMITLVFSISLFANMGLVLKAEEGAPPSSPQHQQEESNKKTREAIWQQREAQRFENQRRDCAAQWVGWLKTHPNGTISEEVFMEDCVKQARTRCHPPGHNPNCVYKNRRQKTKEREEQLQNHK